MSVEVRKLNEYLDGFEIRTGQYVYFEESVVNRLDKYRHQVTEAGGLILGSYRGDHIHVRHITEPQKGDTRQRYSFHRRDLKHLKIADRMHRNSNGEIATLGEWHSHPENMPKPSGIDFREWEKILKHRKPLSSIFLIIGYTGRWLGIAE